MFNHKYLTDGVMMEFLGFVVFLVFGLIASYAWYFSKERKMKRVFSALKRNAIADCLDNSVNRIEGRLQLVGKPLKAPLSYRLCALFKVRVEKLVKSGKSRTWHKIIEHNLNSHFLLRDGEDYAYIDSDKAEVYLEKDARFESGFANDASDRLEAFLSAFGEESTTLFGMINHTLRYMEGVLEEGEAVAVCGRGSWQSVDNYKELFFLKEKGIEKVFVFADNEDVPLHISDDVDILNLE